MQINVLNHMRWIAAVIVATHHFRSYIFIDYRAYESTNIFIKVFYFITAIGPQAVVAFFVISGFLVGGKLLEFRTVELTEQRSWNFLIDRFSRISIVLWPAIVLAAVIQAFVLLFLADMPIVNVENWSASWSTPPARDASILIWISQFLLLNEFVTKTAIINSPLWSLAYEWYYYMAGLAVTLLALRVVKSTRMIWLVAYASVLTAIALLGNLTIIISGTSWVVGLIARHVYNRKYLTCTSGAFIAAATYPFALVCQSTFHLPDLVTAVPLAALLANTCVSRVRTAERFGHAMANFSYSLYAVHVPIGILLIVLFQYYGGLQQRVALTPLNFLFFLAHLGTVLIAARVFAYFTEDQTENLRQFLRRAWRKRTASVAP